LWVVRGGTLLLAGPCFLPLGGGLLGVGPRPLLRLGLQLLPLLLLAGRARFVGAAGGRPLLLLLWLAG
jgi:hypothetical protein